VEGGEGRVTENKKKARGSAEKCFGVQKEKLLLAVKLGEMRTGTHGGEKCRFEKAEGKEGSIWCIDRKVVGKGEPLCKDRGVGLLGKTVAWGRWVREGAKEGC